MGVIVLKNNRIILQCLLCFLLLFFFAVITDGKKDACAPVGSFGMTGDAGNTFSELSSYVFHRYTNA